jgi:hypothetical protein
MKYLVSLLLFGCVLTAAAQDVLENNPPSVKWYKIKTPHFRILYPKGFEAEAQRVANTLEHIREPEAKSLGVEPRKISIVLQNQSAVSNGFVSMVPRRSEFYAMPSQNYNFTGTNDWLDLLASHEYRHIVQFQRANTGFNKLLYYVFGPATFSAMAQTSVPQWFWEGDAVVTETAFTRSGRGRIPNFGLVFRTNLLEGRTFNYHKQYLRSYKHHIPDHYVLGYYMTAYLRNKLNDADAWEHVTRRTWSVPFIPFAFSNSIKKESGKYVVPLYNEMANALQEKWKNQIDQLELTQFESIHSRKGSAYTDYKYPQVLDGGRVVVMKEGIGDIEQFVVIQDGEVSNMFTPGILNETGMLSAVGSILVWNEQEYDPRWRVKNYSVIKMFDVDQRKLKTITKKSRYAGAALSPDQTKIVTVETNTAYQTNLVVLDTSGVVLRKFENKDNSFYSMPRWSTRGSDIVVLKTNDKGRTVAVVNFNSGDERQLLPYTDENIGYPVLLDQYLLYNSPISGIDNVYALDLSTNGKFQVTTSKYGAYNPAISADQTTLYYNEQTRDGLNVVNVSFDPGKWKPMASVKIEEDPLYEPLVEQEGHEAIFDNVPTNSYSSSRYHTVSGIVNPYSWGAVFNTSFTGLEIGVASQDVLSTTSLKAGYFYDIYEREGAWQAGISYQKWTPIIDVNVSYAKRSVNEGELFFLAIDTVQTQPQVQLDSSLFTQNVSFAWKEKTMEVGLRIPLVTTQSRFLGNITFSNYVGVTKVSDFNNSINNARTIPAIYRSGPSTPLTPSPNEAYYFFRDYVSDGTLLYNHFGLSAYRLLKRSRRDINSKWGQVINLNWFSTPYGGDFSGNQFSFYTLLYFPGVFKHHSIWGYWAYQGTDLPQSSIQTGEGIDNYVFNNQVPLPRGLAISRFEKFYSMSLNYTLPLWYPDMAIGPLVNIQRFRANAFIDYGFGSTQRSYGVISQAYTSVGGELKVDFNVMRTLPQFNMGIRYSYGLQPVVTKFEILIGTFNF